MGIELGDVRLRVNNFKTHRSRGFVIFICYLCVIARSFNNNIIGKATKLSLCCDIYY